MLLYLANLAQNLAHLRVFANICRANIRDRTLIVYCIDGETPNLIAANSLYFEKRQILIAAKIC